MHIKMHVRTSTLAKFFVAALIKVTTFRIVLQYLYRLITDQALKKTNKARTYN